MILSTDSKTGEEKCKLTRGEQSAIVDVISWLTACAKHNRFPQAQAAIDALQVTRKHVDKAPETDGKA